MLNNIGFHYLTSSCSWAKSLSILSTSSWINLPWSSLSCLLRSWALLCSNWDWWLNWQNKCLTLAQINLSLMGYSQSQVHLVSCTCSVSYEVAQPEHTRWQKSDFSVAKPFFSVSALRASFSCWILDTRSWTFSTLPLPSVCIRESLIRVLNRFSWISLYLWCVLPSPISAGPVDISLCLYFLCCGLQKTVPGYLGTYTSDKWMETRDSFLRGEDKRREAHMHDFFNS